MLNQHCTVSFKESNSFQPQKHNNQYNYSQSNYFNGSLQTYSYTNPKSRYIVNKNKNDSCTCCNSIKSYQSLQNNHYEVPPITNHTVFNETRNNHCQYTNSSANSNMTHFQHTITIANRTPKHEPNTNYNENTNKCNKLNMTMLQDTLTIETLLYTLKKGITNAQNALLIAKMVSILINKTENDEIAK
eukprot:452069_1